MQWEWGTIELWTPVYTFVFANINGNLIWTNWFKSFWHTVYKFGVLYMPYNMFIGTHEQKNSVGKQNNEINYHLKVK